jgi:hypothetical protein
MKIILEASMTSLLYDYTLPIAPTGWQTNPDLATWNWDEIPSLDPFTLYDNSAPASHKTRTRVCCNQQALYIRYDCTDHDIWGTYTQRDEPIYDEEVVEIFIGHGVDNPVNYYELQISPNGVLFDAKITNPTSTRADLVVDTTWDGAGIQWLAKRNDAENHWMAVLVIPWEDIAPEGTLPKVWRANFYRIERPRDAQPEYSCWSPTMVEPADFHKPARFGILRLPDV